MNEVKIAAPVVRSVENKERLGLVWVYGGEWPDQKEAERRFTKEDR